MAMRQLKVYCGNDYAGLLTEKSASEYVFRYDDGYYANPSMSAISLTLPKNQQEYTSKYLFPFFTNMLSEGANRRVQCRLLKLDENDYFGRLMATENMDMIGCVTVKQA